MNQFDIYLNPIKRSRNTYPFVCSVQNNLYGDLASQIVAFVCKDESLSFDKLSVPILVYSQRYFICLNVLATMETSRFETFITNVVDQRDSILAAYDALFTGI